MWIILYTTPLLVFLCLDGFARLGVYHYIYLNVYNDTVPTTVSGCPSCSTYFQPLASISLFLMSQVLLVVSLNLKTHRLYVHKT